MSVNLTADQEAEAHRLVEQLKQQAADPLLAIARLLVASDESTLFGRTEFAIRKHALDVISQAYNLHLAEKKTATGAARSTAHSAAKRRRTTGTASGMRKASGE
jgi:hypothetical protein